MARMEVTVEEMKVLKMNILGGMNTYILEHGDEYITEEWQRFGVPDCATKEDLEEIATDENLWVGVCVLFGRLTKELH